MMTRRNDAAIAKIAVILIPVIAGSILGLMASIITNYYTFQIAQKDTIRKERMVNIERAMMLTDKYLHYVTDTIVIGFTNNGNATSHDKVIITAQVDTLRELKVVILLYFPQLRSDIEQLVIAHKAMMNRYKDIIDYINKHSGEDTNNVIQRIQKEVAPIMDDTNSLMNKLIELGQRNDT